MISTTARILIGLIVGTAMLIAIMVALATDLFAPETRPTLQRPRITRRRAASRSLIEAGT